MAFGASTVFRSYVSDVIDNTTAMDIGTDASIKVALYNDTSDIATAKNDTSIKNAYNGTGGSWVTANELTGGGATWVAGGTALVFSGGTGATGARKTDGTAYVMVDADDVAPGGTNTITAAKGCLVYDDTITTPVADQAFCANYFGGAQTVTGGTFSIVWSTSGIFRLTV